MVAGHFDGNVVQCSSWDVVMLVGNVTLRCVMVVTVVLCVISG